VRRNQEFVAERRERIGRIARQRPGFVGRKLRRAVHRRINEV
jgi:hypothetical protein